MIRGRKVWGFAGHESKAHVIETQVVVLEVDQGVAGSIDGTEAAADGAAFHAQNARLHQDCTQGHGDGMDLAPGEDQLCGARLR